MTSCDIGDAGPAEGPPEDFRWSLWWSLGSRVGWFLLLPLMLLKENRRRAAWWIAAPMALEIALLAGLGRWLSILEAVLPLSAVATALAALCLLGDRLARRSAWGRVGAALAIWCLACGVAWGIAAESLSRLLELLPALLAGLVFVGACGLSARRRRPGFGSFALRMLAWLVAIMALLAVVLLFVFIGASWNAGMLEYLLPITGAALFWGAAMGVAIWLLLAPFLLLGARNALYNKRLKAILSLEERPGDIL
ncbi:MAG: hypothetical protein KA248_04865 [Kiritimatiellae bacterium]|nr:hypothetical protein [Kiritimatiellia bacterium]